ncbi:calcium-binding protein [Fulvimarina endophytica]|uniref:Calcium-binding protein n=1 Tax=Fulvimarina endophytica TaxID=2293836 RepID=A0A371X4B6_9HYPH|nr:Tim44/TimA family putative adaptor protein [Fulvimarina endophytica]RFC64060.1 calcium-binding protein [Fulvimarina endophytica]
MSFGTIFIIVLAAIVLFQLYNVLGRRTGNERPPYDPYSRNRTGEAREGERAEDTGGDNVVTLPSRRTGERAEETQVAPRYAKIDKVAEPHTPLNKELRRIQDADPAFDPEEFIEGAKIAYEMVVDAFAQGDRTVLKNLLSPEVYEGFEAAISAREASGETMRSSFIGIDDAKIVSAELRGREALVTTRIISEMISATLDSKGDVLDGDMETVVEVRDIWTFGRDTKSRDPNWKLVGTESED